MKLVYIIAFLFLLPFGSLAQVKIVLTNGDTISLSDYEHGTEYYTVVKSDGSTSKLPIDMVATILTSDRSDLLVTIDADTMKCIIEDVKDGYLSFKQNQNSNKASKITLDMLASYRKNGDWNNVLDKNGNVKNVNAIIESSRTDPNDSTKSEFVGLKTQSGVIELEASISDLYNSETRINRAGQNLIQSSKVFYAGVIMSLTGTLVSSLSVIPSNSRVRTGMLIGGGVLGATGAIFTLSAFVPISKAGIELKSVKFVRPK